MPESGLPGTSSQPPSYIRPPRRASESLVQNPWLLFVVGIAVIILCLWMFRGAVFSGVGQTHIQGSLIFYDSLENVTLQNYSLTGGTVSSLSNLGTSISSISASPDGSHVVFSTKTPSSIKVASLKDGTQKVVAPESSKYTYAFPLISNDGSKAAYIELSKVGSRLLISTLVGTNTATIVMPYAWIPEAFSPNGAKLLARTKDHFMLLSLINKAPATLTGFPQLDPQTAHVPIALSSDGKMIAITSQGTISWGTMDWDKGAFTVTTHIPSQSQEFFFDETNALLVVEGGSVHSYGSNGSSSASRSVTLPAGAKILTWLSK